MISVLTPTLNRPEEVAGLYDNLSRQICLPGEWILIDAAEAIESETAQIIQEKTLANPAPFSIKILKNSDGTALQRNVGIDAARGDFIAFVDDDIRLNPDFFQIILKTFEDDRDGRVGGITGYISNQFLDPLKSPRWRLYKRLNLFATYEPGRYDFRSGTPINRYLQPPHDGLREIDFMGAGCAVWRRRVFDEGLRFSDFFRGYGILEDAHLALRARKKWRLLEHGQAKCIHLRATSSRLDVRKIMMISAVNHRFVFMDIVPDRDWGQEFRFWRLQWIDLARLIVYALLKRNRASWEAVLGKMEGIYAASKLRPPKGSFSV